MALIRVNVPGLKKLKVVPYTTSEFVYNGEVQTPVWEDFDPTAYKITGETSATTAGTHYMELVPTGKWVWADGTRKKKLFPFVIKKQPVTVPTVTDTVKTYNRFSQSPTISAYDSSLVSVTGNSAIVVGEYSTVLSLKDKNNYCWADVGDCWSDAAISDRITPWRINILYLPKVTATKTELPYSFGYQNLPVNNYDSNYITIAAGRAGATELGDYEVTYRLRSPTNVHWLGGSIDDITIPWKIVKRVLSSAESSFTQDSSSALTYTGNELTFLPSNWNSTLYKITGNKATDAGTYTATISLADPERETWADGSTGNKTVSFTIDRKPLAVPYTYSSFTYDGYSKTPSWYNYDSNLMRISGDYENKTDAKTYTAKFDLIDTKNYCWADDKSTGSKYATWTINKRIASDPPVWVNSNGYIAEFTYDGYVHSPNISIPDGVERVESWEDSNVTTEAENAGSYRLKFRLRDKSNTTWSDGGTGTKTYSWRINKRDVTLSARAAVEAANDYSFWFFNINYFDKNYGSGNLPTIIVTSNKTDYPFCTYEISSYSENSGTEVGRLVIHLSPQIFSYTNKLTVKFPGSNNLKSSNEVTVSVKYTPDT